LLCVVVIQVITKELQAELLWEFVYADSLIFMAKSDTELREKIVKCKAGMEIKGLKMNA